MRAISFYFNTFFLYISVSNLQLIIKIDSNPFFFISITSPFVLYINLNSYNKNLFFLIIYYLNHYYLYNFYFVLKHFSNIIFTLFFYFFILQNLFPINTWFRYILLLLFDFSMYTIFQLNCY